MCAHMPRVMCAEGVGSGLTYSPGEGGWGRLEKRRGGAGQTGIRKPRSGSDLMRFLTQQGPPTGAFQAGGCTESLGPAFSEKLHTLTHTLSPCAVGVPAWQRPQHKED